MNELKEPIRNILFQYCHVECYEVNDLKQDISGNDWLLNTEMFKNQMQEIIKNPEDYMSAVNDLTGNEFESGDELREWANNIFLYVFTN